MASARTMRAWRTQTWGLPAEVLKLETIDVPERPANVSLGGPDRKTLFITARTSLYAVKMRVSGQ